MIYKNKGGVALAKQTVFVKEFTDGILDPNGKMLGPVKDGGTIIANTAPGCWGPMITPELKGGHEVTVPVYVEGAEVGDAIAIYIQSITPTSSVVASGNDITIDNNFNGDPFVAGKCPHCGIINPATELKGIGEDSVRCKNCNEDISPFKFTNGYTMAFDENKQVGITLSKEAAYEAAKNARDNMCIPDNSIQNPIVNFAPHHMAGNISRLRPFLGQLGTTPSKAIPDSHNAGDFGSFLIGAPHDYSFTEEELKKHKTDGHMDINRVRAGAILIAPVKVKGGGVYVGDAHAMQGDGEIAGHTADIAALVTLKVKVLKNLNIDGPILIPLEEDLPYLAKTISKREYKIALDLGKKWGVENFEKTAPISFIGTGVNLNQAIENGLQRAADVLDLSVPEVMNRATINGAIEIGRAPGTVTVTFLAPVDSLKKAGLYHIIKEHYGLYD
ncbi:MAG: acetamidase/formamidase family protein [Tissierellia bacterium]|nr:acetamidase/formamidase family protein [Tissierellia bacterium]